MLRLEESQIGLNGLKQGQIRLHSIKYAKLGLKSRVIYFMRTTDSLIGEESKALEQVCRLTS